MHLSTTIWYLDDAWTMDDPFTLWPREQRETTLSATLRKSQRKIIFFSFVNIYLVCVCIYLTLIFAFLWFIFTHCGRKKLCEIGILCEWWHRCHNSQTPITLNRKYHFSLTRSNNLGTKQSHAPTTCTDRGFCCSLGPYFFMFNFSSLPWPGPVLWIYIPNLLPLTYN